MWHRDSSHCCGLLEEARVCKDTALMHVVCTTITALKYYHIACFVSGLLQMSGSNTDLISLNINNSFSLSIVEENHSDSSHPT